MKKKVNLILIIALVIMISNNVIVNGFSNDIKKCELVAIGDAI